jgi:hypothetical protein
MEGPVGRRDHFKNNHVNHNRGTTTGYCVRMRCTPLAARLASLRGTSIRCGANDAAVSTCTSQRARRDLVRLDRMPLTIVADRVMKVFFLFLGALLLYHTAGAVIDYHRVPPYESPTTYTVQKPPLDTPWTYLIGSNPWSEYPRPQLQRSDWQNLNGIWKYRNATGPNEPPPWNQDLPHEVLIPSCLESALSGIQGAYTIHSWFSTNFTVPGPWQGRRVLLNFGAVDYEAVVYVR